MALDAPGLFERRDVRETSTEDVQNATYTQKGVASFNITDFDVVQGAVSGKAGAGQDLIALGSGTFTINTTTGAVDIDYVDIPITANQLAATDIIVLEIMGECSDKVIKMALHIDDVTNPLDLGYNMVTVSKPYWHILRLIQDPNSNSTLISVQHTVHDSATIAETIATGDTGDANIMTNAFTIRINPFNDPTPAAADKEIRYNVYAIKG